MPAPDLHNSHRTSVAFFFEAQPGTTPGDAAGWASAEASPDGFRMMVKELDPSFIVGSPAVENVDLHEETHQVTPPYKGIPNADGGSMVSRLWGTAQAHSDGEPVTPTALGRLLVHALGGGATGRHTMVDSVPDDDPALSLEVADAQGLEVGHLIAIAKASAPDRPYVVQVTAVAGTAVSYDRELPFVVEAGDLVLGCEMAWPDVDALTNPQDPDASTVSMLVQKGPHTWVAGGAHLELTEVRLERGQQPELAWSILAGRGYPPGDGAPTVPIWTQAVEGLAFGCAAVGHGTKCHLQEAGSTQWFSESVFSAKCTVGVPVKPQDGVTEVDEGMPGRIGYMTEPAATTFEMVVALTTEQQTRWKQGTELRLTYWQSTPGPGHGYALHIPRGFLAQAPAPVLEGSNRWRVVVQATHTVGAAEAASKKLILARF